MTSYKKPGVAFWATVAAIVVLVAYPLSIGPVESLRHKRLREQGIKPRSIWDTTDRLYAPLGWCYEKAPGWILRGMDWYGEVWH